MEIKDIEKFIKTPYFKVTFLILIGVIVLLTLTQSLWMNAGIGLIYNEYPVSDIKIMNSQTYIVKGNYVDNYLYDMFDESNIVYVVVSNYTDCQIKNGVVKMLVVNEDSFIKTNGTFRRMEFNLTSKETKEDIPRVILLKVLQGCNN